MDRIVKQRQPGKPSSDLAEATDAGALRSRPLIRYCAKVFAITDMEVRKLRHDPTELLTRTIQPMLWLLVFGQVFARTRAIPTGNLDYIDFLAPGILAQSVLFVAIFYGISVIWERDMGIMHVFLVSPTPRTALVLGKAIAAGIRALSQAVVIYLLALLLGVKMLWSPAALIGVVGLVLLGAALFSTFSLIIACIVKTRERFMGIGQILTMPLFFASNAIYPMNIMPPWLQQVAHANQLTYEVDGLRALMLNGGVTAVGLGVDFGVLATTLALLVLIAGWMYPRIIT
jgi:ABC-2 type transport system permease protein